MLEFILIFEEEEFTHVNGKGDSTCVRKSLIFVKQVVLSYLLEIP